MFRQDVNPINISFLKQYNINMKQPVINVINEIMNTIILYIKNTYFYFILAPLVVKHNINLYIYENKQLKLH